MISRLTALAATFAVLATATLSYAASVHQSTLAAPAAPAAATKQVRIVELQRVVVTGKRIDASQR